MRATLLAMLSVLALVLTGGGPSAASSPGADGWSAAQRIGRADSHRAVSIAEHDGHLYVLAIAPRWKGCRSWLYTDRSGAWERELVPVGCDGGELAVDAQGHVHIAFIRFAEGDCAGWCPKGLFHATDRSGSWRTERILLGYAQPPSIAIGPGGQPVVAYHGAGGKLWLATRTADGWQRRAIGGQTAVDLPFDRQGLAVHGDRILVAFVRWVGEERDALRLIEVENGNVVRRSTVARAGETWDPLFPALVVDELGRPHVGFIDGCDGLAHAVRSLDGWRVESIPGRAALDAGPEMSVTDGTHVALVTHTASTTRCSGGNSGGVLFRTDEGGDWSSTTLEPKGVPLAGDVGIVTDGTGRSSVVWVTRDGDLMFRRQR